MTRRTLAVVLLAQLLGGCGGWEHASVAISYGSTTAAMEYRSHGNTREHVAATFQRVTERNGYKCRAGIKRTEELTCRGPRDLHVVFRPSLNRQEFVADFSWADVAGRTHEEFMSHVLELKNALSRALGEANVQLRQV